MTNSKSNWQVIWAVLCAQADLDPGPVEISAIVPEVATRLGVRAREADREISFLLTELERMPEGHQFFNLEGNAVVPQREFLDLPADLVVRIAAYPFEL